jgi:class 3 adenylate cyclase
MSSLSCFSGFTAWSSQRDPGEVFTFLHNLYHEFNMASQTMGVFMVKTIGDCYVAATGLPEPQADHPVRMAKFSAKCMLAMVEVTRHNFKVRLGPESGELHMRTGLYSGPVMAGVLKGAKARFQLFGK